MAKQRVSQRGDKGILRAVGADLLSPFSSFDRSQKWKLGDPIPPINPFYA